MTKIVVFGSSHTKAISRASAGTPEFECYWVKNPNKEDAPGDITLEDAVKLAGNMDRTDKIAVSWAGTSHNIIGLVQHKRPFDFIEPGSSEPMDRTREIIPYNLLRHYFADIVRKDTFSRTIKERSPAMVSILATPPVKGDDIYLLERAKSYRGMDVQSMGITPAAIRAKLWRLEMTVLQEFSAEIGAGFIPAPDRSLTPDGFLSPAFWAMDATHANDEYGKLVVDQLLRAA